MRLAADGARGCWRHSRPQPNVLHNGYDDRELDVSDIDDDSNTIGLLSPKRCEMY